MGECHRRAGGKDVYQLGDDKHHVAQCVASARPTQFVDGTLKSNKRSKSLLLLLLLLLGGKSNRALRHWPLVAEAIFRCQARDVCLLAHENGQKYLVQWARLIFVFERSWSKTRPKIDLHGVAASNVDRDCL
jgi:hypothetical protein